MMSTTIVWAILGILLVIAEVFTSTFVLLFFGIAALIVAGVRELGLDNVPVEVALFGALGLAMTLLLRKRIRMSLEKGGGYRADDRIVVDGDIPPKSSASISYQGSVWTALNESDIPLKRGDRAVVVRTEGVRLVIRPE